MATYKLDWMNDIAGSLGKPSNGYFNLDYASAPAYVRNFGNDTVYALDFTLNGRDYIYVPKNVVEKGGVQTGDGANLFPWFANGDNLKSFGSNAAPVDVSSSWAKDYLSKRGLSTDGYLLPADQAAFDGAVTVLSKAQLGGDLTNLKNTENGVAFGVSGGHGNRYFTIGDGNYTTFHDPYMSGGSSLLGKWTGGLADNLGISDALYSVAKPVNDFFQTDAGKALLLADLGNSLYNAASSSAASTAGSEAGNAAAADNIDMGGGWNPATGTGDGATAAAAALAPAKELSAAEVSDMINAEQAQNMSAQEAADKIAEEQAANAGASGAAAAGGGLADYGLALAGAQAAAALGSSLLAPDMSGSGSSSFQAKDYKPDYNKKFDAPVEWADVPEWNFQMSNTPEPYLQQSQAGQFTGPALFDPSQPYASGLIQGLRAGSNAPTSQNLGFTLFSTAKP